MIIDGKIVLFNNIDTDMRTQAIADVREGILKITDEHLWNLNYIDVSALTEMFLSTFYGEFQTKKNGNLVYPISRLESWILTKRPRVDCGE